MRKAVVGQHRTSPRLPTCKKNVQQKYKAYVRANLVIKMGKTFIVCVKNCNTNYKQYATDFKSSTTNKNKILHSNSKVTTRSLLLEAS